MIQHDLFDVFGDFSRISMTTWTSWVKPWQQLEVLRVKGWSWTELWRSLFSSYVNTNAGRFTETLQTSWDEAGEGRDTSATVWPYISITVCFLHPETSIRQEMPNYTIMEAVRVRTPERVHYINTFLQIIVRTFVFQSLTWSWALCPLSMTISDSYFLRDHKWVFLSLKEPHVSRTKRDINIPSIL